MPQTDELVSVIVPYFNSEKYIDECIRSILNQTYSNIEIIIIDDGSNRESFLALQKVVLKYNKVLLLSQKHRGPGSARNLGIEKAKGEYIAFLDSDDLYFDADAIELMVNVCRKHSALVCGSFRNEYRSNHYVNTSFLREYTAAGSVERRVDFLDYQYDFFFQSFIYERNLILNNNISFGNYMRYEDPMFLLQALDVAGCFYVCPTILHCYRKGHQDILSYKRYTCDTLKGIRDSLIYCERKGYRKLYYTILGRLDWMYYDNILEDKSEEAHAVLCQINEIYLRNEPIKSDGMPLFREYQSRRDKNDSSVLSQS